LFDEENLEALFKRANADYNPEQSAPYFMEAPDQLRNQQLMKPKKPTELAATSW
jgi:hypothetical protein